MKTLKGIVTAVTLGVVLGNRSAHAGITTTDFSTTDGITYTGGSSSGSQVIPDNTPAGAGYSINFGATGQTITGISVSLNLSGGYNGDIYAYVSHGGQNILLMNQIGGTAATGSGFNITLVEGTGNSIQTASGTAGAVLGGVSGVNFTADQDLSAFNNTDANGAWTLFFADLSPGDTSTLNSFSVSITAVPEPVNVALGFFGAGLLALGGVRIWRARRAQNSSAN